VAALLLTTTAFAQTAEEKGLAIAKTVEQNDQGWGDTTAQMKITLHNRYGDETVLMLRAKTLEVDDNGDKTLIIVDNTRNMKGIAFLSFTHKTANADQWLYLPALKRVKRIQSSNVSGSFLGSQFAYEDLKSFEVEHYTYRYLRDEVVNGENTNVVEYGPVDVKSGYARQLVWIDAQRLIPLKIEFYDRKNSLLKTLDYSYYNLHKGKYWRAGRLEMENHQTGNKTSLSFENYKFNTGISDRDFNRNSLMR
jgi:outer membrane lipoprotein-sorting protein